MIFINRNGLYWRDALKHCGSDKTLGNRWTRWSDKGVFVRVLAGLAAEHGEERTVIIDAAYLKAQRPAWAPDWLDQGQHEYQAAFHLRLQGPAAQPARHRPSGQRLYRRTGIAEQPAGG